MNRILIALVCATTLIFSNTFYFTAIPDQDESKLELRFSLLANYLSKALDLEVKFIPVKSYSASIAAFRNNQVQLAWFGGLSGVRARLLVPDSLVLAQGYEDPNFKTYFIANKNLKITKSSTLSSKIKNQSFTFGSKGSTSGRLMPEYFLREHFKKAPSSLFSKVGYSGSHTKTIALVQSGAYKIGAVNFKVWLRELELGNIDLSKVDVIWETPTYADYQFTARGDLDKTYGKGFTKKLAAVLINIKDKNILNAFPRKSFIKAQNSDFDAILEVGKKIGLID
ncbi:MAG: putative selenate ABC transporter substrate-binding protein [Campylobacteraceae bacterium]|nr:putative selenate ABC transporter substrate-binding protein [Campylobacteraceae bacterium]